MVNVAVEISQKVMPGAFGRSLPGYMWFDTRTGMMRAAFTSFLLGTALAFPLAGCAALDVLSGDLILNKTWFPFLDGSTWEYNVRNADGEVGTASIALTGVTMGDDGTGEGTITYRFPTRPTF